MRHNKPFNHVAHDANPKNAKKRSTILNSKEPTISKANRWLADACLLATATMWGANILVFKHAIQVINPWAFNAYRLILATTTLGILAWLESRSKPAERKPYSIIQLLCFSMLTGFVYLLVFVKGISLTTAGNTALIFSSMPMWAALISLVFAKERLPAVTWGGLLVTFLGTVLVTTQSSGKISFASEYFVGNLLILCAALTWATGTVLSRSLLKAFSPLRLAFISAMITTPMHLALIGYDLPANWNVATSGMTFWEIVYSGVFSTGLAYASWHVGVGILGASHAAVYQNVVTLVAVIGGWLFLHERPLWAQIVGGILIVAGLILMRRGRE